MNLIPPGAFIAVLGFIAAVMSFFDLPKRGWKRAVLVCLLFCLMLGEIWVIQREQNTANIHFLYLTDRFNSTDGLLMATQLSQTRVDALAQQPLTPGMELKRTAVTLSSEILKFLIQRNTDEPPLPTLGDLTRSQPGGFGPWQIAADNYSAYSAQTANLYMEKFGPSVVMVHDELKKQGLTSKQFDMDYQYPGNILGVAEQMGTLAEQIP